MESPGGNVLEDSGSTATHDHLWPVIPRDHAHGVAGAVRRQRERRLFGCGHPAAGVVTGSLTSTGADEELRLGRDGDRGQCPCRAGARRSDHLHGGRILGTPWAGTQYLLAVADPGHAVTDPDQRLTPWPSLTLKTHPQIDQATIIPGVSGATPSMDHNTGDLPSNDIAIDYYWSTSATPFAPGSTATTQDAVADTGSGDRGAGWQEDNLDASSLLPPPFWAKYLVAEINPGVPSVNVEYASSLPITRIAPTATFAADPGTPVAVQTYHVYVTITNNNWYPMGYSINWNETFADPTMRDAQNPGAQGGKSGTVTTNDPLLPSKASTVELGSPGSPTVFDRTWLLIPDNSTDAEQSPKWMQHIEAALKKSAEMITSAYLPKLYKAAKELETTHYNIKKVDKSLTSIENELSTADQLVAANPNLHVTARTDFYSSATPQDGGNSVISSGGNSIILTIGRSARG